MDEHDEKPESLDRLWDPKLEILGELLDQLVANGAMDLEELDGFFAALHCCPQLVPSEEYLPEVFGTDEPAEQDDFFRNREVAHLLFTLLIHHWNSVGEAFRTGDFFLPLLLEDENGKAYGNYWAMGFLRGMDMRQESWREILDDDSKAPWLLPIFTLADETLIEDEDHPRPDYLPDKVAITDEHREELLMAVSAAVTDMYRYFAPHRLRNSSIAANSTVLQKNKKLGRNDPCYCGSGKKYKKCCGAIPLN